MTIDQIVVRIKRYSSAAIVIWSLNAAGFSEEHIALRRIARKRRRDKFEYFRWKPLGSSGINQGRIVDCITRAALAVNCALLGIPEVGHDVRATDRKSTRL